LVVEAELPPPPQEQITVVRAAEGHIASQLAGQEPLTKVSLAAAAAALQISLMVLAVVAEPEGLAAILIMCRVVIREMAA
jgi:hypothetical protein